MFRWIYRHWEFSRTAHKTFYSSASFDKHKLKRKQVKPKSNSTDSSLKQTERSFGLFFHFYSKSKPKFLCISHKIVPRNSKGRSYMTCTWATEIFLIFCVAEVVFKFLLTSCTLVCVMKQKSLIVNKFDWFCPLCFHRVKPFVKLLRLI